MLRVLHSANSSHSVGQVTGGADERGAPARLAREVLARPWDTFVGGHARTGDRADVERALAYLEALYDAVRDGMLAGRSLAQLQREIRLDEFDDLANDEAWLPLNVAGVYRTLDDQSYIRRRP